MNIKIAPSILSCDFANLADELQKVEKAGADMVHVDVMDGHFVQNLTMGPQIVSAIKKSTSLFLDVHLMMYNPYDYIERFVAAGAGRITFHCEATEDIEDTIAFIRKCNNVQVGLAISPDTSVSMLTRYIPFVDAILVMTVHPGFGGQAFIEPVLGKIEYLKEQIDKHNLKTESGNPVVIEVDGGINTHTAKLCYEKGAREFVSGSFLFKADDMQKAISEMRDIEQ